MGSVVLSQINKDDKIVLKSDFGPEGSINHGIVEETRNSGILTDFGSKYAYLIPLNAIKTHLKLVQNSSNKTMDTITKVKSKNQIKL